MKVLQGDHINVGGHKVSLAALGIAATIGAALLFLRNNSGGGAADTSASGNDLSGTVAALQAQLQAISSQPPASPVSPSPSSGTSSTNPAPAPVSAGSQNVQSFITVGKWPNWNGSLSGIAQHEGLSLQAVENLNPWILQQRHTWNLIYPGEKIRIR